MSHRAELKRLSRRLYVARWLATAILIFIAMVLVLTPSQGMRPTLMALAVAMPLALMLWALRCPCCGELLGAPDQRTVLLRLPAAASCQGCGENIDLS